MTDIIVVQSDKAAVVQQQLLERVVEEIKTTAVVEQEKTDVVVTDGLSTDIVQYEETQQVVIQDDTTTFIVTGLLPPPTLGSIFENPQNIDTTNLQNGSVLVYSATLQKWISTLLLQHQIIDCGEY
jgi:hypothetical protein